MKISKTILFAFLASALMSTNSFAQNKGGSSGNCVKQGDVIIDGFYGYPYLVGAVLKAAVNSTPQTSLTVHNFGTVGGKLEYMISDKVGIGAEFTYSNANAKYQDSINAPTYTAGVKKIRVLGRFNFHFATTSSIDPYFTIGMGYKNTSYYDNQPGYAYTWPNLIPVAVRIGVGLHYYFTDFLGLNAELGIGGPMMQAGLSFKF